MFTIEIEDGREAPLEPRKKLPEFQVLKFGFIIYD